ncbi:MAG TPA: RND transporter, partial [Verrucomicrobia subdivision 3 bacterium]|nr:RND transporter [Limisphaerales bacterium]
MNKRIRLLLPGIVLVLAGCTLAPKYTQPAAPVPDAWPTGPAYTAATPTNAVVNPDLNWLEFFPDEKMRQVIRLALANNRDLRVAALNVERA